jgi:glycosyltransferase involved in cell wall biosynthesis
LPRFSLIVATITRTTELRCLLESLTQQDFRDYEVIFADQNDDDRVQRIMDEFAGKVPSIRVECPKGACKARNAALPLASGELIAFPDDDCWYPRGLLKNIDQWFRDYPKYSILAIGAVDESGRPSGNRWVQSSCDLHPINIFRTTFCSSLFMRRDAVRNVSFDEEIGPGSSSVFGCGDETDFVLNVLNSGFQGRFDRTWKVGHPRRDMLSNGVSSRRAVTYGSGMGRVLRKHSLYVLWAGLLSYDVLRGFVVVARGRLSAASLCFAHARGLLRGFVASFNAQDALRTEAGAHASE